MQYILTDKEYSQLVNRAEVDLRDLVLETLRTELLKAAGVKCRQMIGGVVYCDLCPLGKLLRRDDLLTLPGPGHHAKLASFICPKDKEWSK